MLDPPVVLVGDFDLTELTLIFLSLRPSLLEVVKSSVTSVRYNFFVLYIPPKSLSSVTISVVHIYHVFTQKE